MTLKYRLLSYFYYLKFRVALRLNSRDWLFRSKYVAFIFRWKFYGIKPSIKYVLTGEE